MARRAAFVVIVSSWLVGVATTVRAQSDETDVPDHVLLEAGGFAIFASTNMVFNSATLGGSTVSFEQDLNLPERAARGFVEGYWRLARRHQLSLGFSRLRREGSGATLTRDINWGGSVFPSGVTAAGELDSSFLSGTYRFAAYRNPRVELGPAVGFGYLSLTAGISSTLAASGPEGNTVSRTVSREVTESTPTGDLGGYVNWWIGRRVYARGDARYILVKPENSTQSITEARASLTWYAWQHFGIGGQFLYNKFRFDRTIVSTDLGGSYRYQGVQVLVSTAF
jgi:hypothetical protein